MPFPFDNVQTIGITSSRRPRRNRGRLPIISKQDKQDPPPPPPSNENDRIYINPTPAYNDIAVQGTVTVYNPVGQTTPFIGSDLIDYGRRDPFSDINYRLAMDWYDKHHPNHGPIVHNRKPIVKDFGPTDPLPEDVANEAKYLVYRSHFFKNRQWDPVDPKIAERVAEALVNIGKIFDSINVQGFLKELREKCPDMEEFIGRLLNKPWRDIPFFITGGLIHEPIMTEFRNGVEYFVGQDENGNKRLFALDTPHGATGISPDADWNVSDPSNPVAIDYERDGVSDIRIYLPIIDLEAREKGLDPNILLIKYLIHEMVHREGGTEIEAYWIANQIMMAFLGDDAIPYLSRLDIDSNAWKQFEREDTEINRRNNTMSDPNNLFGRWMNVDTFGNVNCNYPS